jgi:hypothetical protein
MSCAGLSGAERGHCVEALCPDSERDRPVGDTVPAVFVRVETQSAEGATQTKLQSVAHRTNMIIIYAAVGHDSTNHVMSIHNWYYLVH